MNKYTIIGYDGNNDFIVHTELKHPLSFTPNEIRMLQQLCVAWLDSKGISVQTEDVTVNFIIKGHVDVQQVPL